jgi:hypothetical protein
MRHTILVLFVLATTAVAQTVTLQSVVVSGGQATVTYSKDFATCAHLKLASTGALVHAQNWFCTSGTNVAISVALSGFNSLFQLGAQVILCHGNNGGICSAPVMITVDPVFTATPPAISLTAGGVQAFTVDASPLAAGATYLIAGSASGTVPGISVGMFHVALNPDDWFNFTIQFPNTPPLSGTLGVIDAAGNATAFLAVPTGLPPSLAGTVVNHVVGIVMPGGVVVGVSQPAPLTLTP